MKRRAARLVDQVADGMLSGAAVSDKLAQLEGRRAELEAELQANVAEPEIILHPAAPARYRQLVERLGEVLAQPETIEIAAARDAFRALISSVVVTAKPRRGEFDVCVETELGPLLGGPSIVALGAGTRNQRFLRLVEQRIPRHAA